jgi:DNA-binding transcriptional regulator YbjK
MGTGSGRRTIDRQRRQRVIAGALDVIAARGVEGLTHRRVAEAAGVPLSATTYYFSSLEDLLAAAMGAAADRDVAALEERFASVQTEADVVAALTAYVQEAVADRAGATVVAELFVAALRRPHLRDLADAWDAAWVDTLSPIVGPRVAVALSTTMAGLMHRALLEPAGPDPETVAATIEQVLGPPGLAS